MHLGPDRTSLDIILDPADSPFSLTLDHTAYADDLCVTIDNLHDGQTKVNTLVQLMRDVADLEFNGSKSHLIALGTAPTAPIPHWDDVHSLNLKYTCTHCTRTFPTRKGATTHARACSRRHLNPHHLSPAAAAKMEITRAFGPPWLRWYCITTHHNACYAMIHEKTYSGPSWRALVRKFWSHKTQEDWRKRGSPLLPTGEPQHIDQMTLYHVLPEDEQRCYFCGQQGKRFHHDIKTNHPMACTHHWPQPPRNSGVFAAFEDSWQKTDQQSKPSITINNTRVPRLLRHKIIGRIVQGNGDDLYDIVERTKRASATLHSLGRVWHNNNLANSFKVTLYRSVAVQLALYGCEAWTLTPAIITHIKNFNKEWLDKIGVPAVFSILAHMHLRRLRFLGHIMRAEPPPQHPLDEPYPDHAFRMALLQVKIAANTTLRRQPHSQHIHWLGIHEADGGACPHTVDFDLDTKATFTPGSLFALVPHCHTYYDLISMFRVGSTATDQTRIWNATARDLADTWARANHEPTTMPHT